MLAEQLLGALGELVEVLLGRVTAQPFVSGAAAAGPAGVANALELEAESAPGEALRPDGRGSDRRGGYGWHIGSRRVFSMAIASIRSNERGSWTYTTY